MNRATKVRNWAERGWLILFLALGFACRLAAQSSNTVQYYYDDAGRLTTVVDPNGNVATYQYDAVGNLLGITKTTLPSSNALAIFNFTPETGPIGQTVYIQGQGFDPTAANDAVEFNGTPTTVSAASANSLTVTVPAGASKNPSANPPSAAQKPPSTYELSTAQRERAIAYSHASYWLYFLGVALSLTIYWFLWLSRFGVFLRNRARKFSSRHFLQCLLFVPAFLIAASLLELPFDFVSGFVLDHRFGLSTESWAGWLADWGKTLGLSVIAGIFVVWILFIIVRRRPRSWWFYFWLATIPISLFVIFIEPFVVEPLFYRFTPLERSRPALVEKIEEMLHHAGLSIPESRIFLMNASSKTHEINAYVSGFGASKRVVVWDTTLEKLTPDEVLLVLGHETGHYVLHHIPKEFVWVELITLGFLAFGFWLVKVLIRRYGARTGIENEGDLASLPVMLLVLTLLTFLSSPAINAESRYYEHQADQFALEVTYGVVPDPNAAMASAFQKLGEVDLSDPSPSPFIKFWLYSHPPLAARIRFAATYKPWAEGKPLKLLPPAKRRRGPM